MATGIIGRASQSVTNQNACGVAEIPREDTNCDSTSQSCFETVSANPFLSSTGAKVVGGVLGAAALAGSLGFGIIQTEGGEQLSFEERAARFIGEGGVLEKRAYLAKAANSYQSAAILLMNDAELKSGGQVEMTDEVRKIYSRALDLLVRARLLRSSVFQQYEQRLAPIDWGLILDEAEAIDDVPPERWRMLLFKAKDAEAYEVSSKIYKKLGNNEMEATLLQGALEAYYSLTREFEVLLAEFGGLERIPQLGFKFKAADIATSLAIVLDKTGNFAEAAKYAEDAALLMDALLDGDKFVPANLASAQNRLRTYFALAEIAQKEQRCDEAAKYYAEMVKVYEDVRSVEGKAWALSMQSYFSGLNYDYKAAFNTAVESASLRYLMVLGEDADVFDEATFEVPEELKSLLPVFQRLSERGILNISAPFLNALKAELANGNHDQPPDTSYETRRDLESALFQLRSAIRNFEIVEPDRDKINPKDEALIRAHLLSLVADCESRLQDYDAVTTTLQELAGFWSLVGDEREAANVRYERIDSLRKTFDFELGRGNKMKAWKLALALETALAEDAAIVQTLGEEFEDIRIELWDMALARAEMQRLARELGVVSAGEPNVDRAIAHSRLRDLALSAQSGDLMVAREFARVAGAAFGKTPEDVLASLQGRGDAQLLGSLRAAVGGSPVLLDRLVRIVSDVPDREAREVRKEERRGGR